MIRGNSSALLTIALVLLAACSGCRGDERTPSAEPSLVPAPKSVPPSAFDLTGVKAEAVFWVLGFLNEYNGRSVIEDRDRVEGLYCNEKHMAERVRTMLRRVQREQQLPDDLREEVVQECLLDFRSPTLARELNRMYASREPSGTFDGSGGPAREYVTLEATPALFARVGSEARLAYLAGAYYRHGVDDGTMRFANAAHKADLIADLLREAGATAVTRETIRGLPNANIVRFKPSSALKAMFVRPDEASTKTGASR
jgi:hypothetical protein